MTHVAVRLLSAADATALTERIRESAEQTWSLLVEAYEGRAWSALGYGSWREYATTEFGMSQSRAYQLLDQARVVSALEAATGSTMVEISERDARDIKPRLAEFVEDVKQRIVDVPDEEHVRQVVAEAVNEFRAEKAENEERRQRQLQHWRDHPEDRPAYRPTEPCPTCNGQGRIPREGT